MNELRNRNDICEIECIRYKWVTGMPIVNMNYMSRKDVEYSLLSLGESLRKLFILSQNEEHTLQ